MCFAFAFVWLFVINTGAESAASQAEIDQHIELGRQFLVAGQLSDALTHYHAAIGEFYTYKLLFELCVNRCGNSRIFISFFFHCAELSGKINIFFFRSVISNIITEGDPHNYMTYFQRGTVYLALGKAKFAMKDFIKVLEIKPDFTAARYQLATVYMKIGDYDTAEHELYQVLQIDPYHQDATYWHSKVAPARDQYVYILDAVNNNNHHHAIQMITQSLEISPWSKELREMRADSYVAVGDVLSAIPDMRSVNRLTQDSTEGYYKLSHLLYQLGHVTDSLKEVRECLKLDPEHKECFPHYKKVKKVEKALTDSRNYLDAEQFEDAIDTSERVLKMESEIPLIIFSAKQILCSAHVKAGKYSEAIAHCREALELSKDPSVLCDRAEAYIETDMFDDGEFVVFIFLPFSYSSNQDTNGKLSFL